MVIRYSTDTIKAQERFDSWREIVCTQLISADADPEHPELFTGTFQYGSFGGMDLSVHASGAHTWHRTPESIRRNPEDDFWLAYMGNGIGCLEQNGNKTVFQDGEFVIYDAARPYQYRLENKSMHIVRLPRAMIERRAPSISSLAGKALDPRRPGMATLLAMLMEAEPLALNADSASSGQEAFGETFFDLVAMAVNLQGEPCSSKADALYKKVLLFIRANISDPSLDLVTIAQAHHVSPRTVTRAFAVRGLSPMSVVWSERLASCRRVLVAANSMQITQVALDHGFTDMSHFSQAFRKAYGCTPSGVIAAFPVK